MRACPPRITDGSLCRLAPSHASPPSPELCLPCTPGLTNHTEGSAARPSTAAPVSTPLRGGLSLSNMTPGSPSRATRQAAWGTHIDRRTNEQDDMRSGPERPVANRDRAWAEPPAPAARVPAASWGSQQQGTTVVRAPTATCVRQPAWMAQAGTKPPQRPASTPASPSMQPAFAPTLVAARQPVRRRTAEGLLSGQPA
eukprot:scaffold32184_cov60-Phaeocystis_antarctica.AAC.1